MSTVRNVDAPRFPLPGGFHVTGLLAPSRGSKQICLWRLEANPATASAPHHLDCDEAFVVLRGMLRVTPAGDLLRAGDAAVVRAGESILVSNPTDDPAEAIVAITAGFTATMEDGSSVGTPPWAQ